MSISQFISLCFSGHSESDSDQDDYENDTIGGIHRQLSDKERCERSLDRLDVAAREGTEIKRETATACKRLIDSSVAVVECLNCPARIGEDSGFELRKDLP